MARALAVFLACVFGVGLENSSWGMVNSVCEIEVGSQRQDLAGDRSGKHEAGSGEIREISPFPQPINKKRASAQHVGAVMALLATFDQAGVLPPESSPQANQLIRSLIQFQSAFLNQESTALQRYLAEACVAELGADGELVYSRFLEKGWTSQFLAAVSGYAAKHPFWDQPTIREVLTGYYLSDGDWGLVVRIYIQSREEFKKKGQDLHEVFAKQRQGMPGGR